MKSLIRFVLIFFVMQSLHAQTPTRNQAVEVLNLYVSYGNETIHALWPTYEELMGFNNSLNWVQPGSRTYMSFSNEDFLNREANYAVLPAVLYQQCLTQSKILSPADQKALNAYLTGMKATLDQMQVHRDSLEIFCKEKWFSEAKNFPWVYRQLEQLERLFAQYKKQKDGMYTEIQRIYTQKYKPANTSHKIVAMVDKFQPALHWCKALLDDLNAGDTAKIAMYTQELDQLIAQYEAQRDENLKGLYRFGANNGLDPYYRYDATVDELKAISSHAHSFLKSNWVSDQYRNYPKTYYYYNEQVINKYNRYGMGVIRYYNEFVDLANGKQVQKNAEIPDYYINNKSIKLDVSVTRLLHAIEEPHQYRVSYPKQKPQENVTAKNSINQKAETPAKNTVTTTETLEGYADNHLIFLLDVSGSMNSPEKLPLLKEAFTYLLTLTRPEDKVALVSYSGEAQIELNTISATEKRKIISKLDKLKSHGGTNANRGLSLAYQLANEHFIEKGNNRIILASDGEFGIDKTTEAMIRENLNRGIALTVFFFGATKNEHIVQQLQNMAELGKGNFHQITVENAKQALLGEAQAIKK